MKKWGTFLSIKPNKLNNSTNVFFHLHYDEEEKTTHMNDRTNKKYNNIFRQMNQLGVMRIFYLVVNWMEYLVFQLERILEMMEDLPLEKLFVWFSFWRVNCKES